MSAELLVSLHGGGGTGGTSCQVDLQKVADESVNLGKGFLVVLMVIVHNRQLSGLGDGASPALDVVMEQGNHLVAIGLFLSYGYASFRAFISPRKPLGARALSLARSLVKIWLTFVFLNIFQPDDGSYVTWDRVRDVCMLGQAGGWTEFLCTFLILGLWPVVLVPLRWALHQAPVAGLPGAARDTALFLVLAGLMLCSALHVRPCDPPCHRYALLLPASDPAVRFAALPYSFHYMLGAMIASAFESEGAVRSKAQAQSNQPDDECSSSSSSASSSSAPSSPMAWSARCQAQCSLHDEPPAQHACGSWLFRRGLAAADFGVLLVCGLGYTAFFFWDHWLLTDSAGNYYESRFPVTVSFLLSALPGLAAVFSGSLLFLRVCSLLATWPSCRPVSQVALSVPLTVGENTLVVFFISILVQKNDSLTAQTVPDFWLLMLLEFAACAFVILVGRGAVHSKLLDGASARSMMPAPDGAESAPALVHAPPESEMHAYSAAGWPEEEKRGGLVV